jgi:hypothetical protein
MPQPISHGLQVDGASREGGSGLTSSVGGVTSLTRGGYSHPVTSGTPEGPGNGASIAVSKPPLAGTNGFRTPSDWTCKDGMVEVHHWVTILISREGR